MFDSNFDNYNNYGDLNDTNDIYYKATIKVVGVGGAGNNAINRMIDAGVSGVDFIAVNTDGQDLRRSKAQKRIQIGRQLTKGLGAGADPDMGAKSAEENKEEIRQVLEGTDLLFITAGMGGGTGTGAAPVIARIARDLGILTVAVVTKPFSFEAKIRERNAKMGLENLRKYVDTLMVIPNDKLLFTLPKNTSFADAFKVADDILRQAICGVVDLITTNSTINLDFADIKTIMGKKGLAHIGIGEADGDRRIIEAVRQAVSSPLLETTIEGAKAVILNVIGGNDITIREAQEAAELVQGIVDKDANIIFGTRLDETQSKSVKIIIIATGFQDFQQAEVKEVAKPISIKTLSQEDFGETTNNTPIYQQPQQKVVEPPVEERLEPTKMETLNQTNVENVGQEQAVPSPIIKKGEVPAFLRLIMGRKKK